MTKEKEHIENLGEQHNLSRLNTYIPKELHKQLKHRDADDLGSLTQQSSDAIRIYLAIFGGYGSLTSEERREIRTYLDQT